MARKDGRHIKTDGIIGATFHLYPHRTEAEVFMKDEFDVTELLKYIEKKNQEDPSIKRTPWHGFLMAMGKVLYNRPYLNRFVCGRKLYERYDKSLGFVVKRQFTEEAEEMMLVAKMKEEYVFDDISHIVIGDAKKLRSGASTGIDGVLNAYNVLPRFLKRMLVGAVKWMGYHGFLPNSFTDDDCHHCTVFLSNLGSIKCDAPYHHLNDFGTCSIFVTVGEIHKGPVFDAEGNMEIRDLVNIGFTLDERIADGFYFAKCVKLVKHIIAHPELLDQPMGEEVEYEY